MLTRVRLEAKGTTREEVEERLSSELASIQSRHRNGTWKLADDMPYATTVKDGWWGYTVAVHNA